MLSINHLTICLQIGLGSDVSALFLLHLCLINNEKNKDIVGHDSSVDRVSRLSDDPGFRANLQQFCYPTCVTPSRIPVKVKKVKSVLIG